MQKKRDFSAQTGEEAVSLRRPTHSRERMRKKKRRPAPFEMPLGWLWLAGRRLGAALARYASFFTMTR
jgi:hypothetical protein